ncbi:MAG TPA: 2-succinyl-5-enolpyruvyl-6-hydroxy-3-cyclohexene-1-carboxylic-acid synthase [Anaerolineae bacterium]|nr:2-succinyl-5-enolpyruvyl-6-hydroxy-3-cyclohexene-1-carboxylic-acid synthase [Anaerolineae bacterium]
MPNRHIWWAEQFIASLVQAGVEAVCIAPGSRSTPLTLACANHPNLRTYLHLDERSAAFFALGLAWASHNPVALLCTSGTAAANFHPAIIEARQTRLPLIILTTDRPPELRHSGANQTIDQIKMFGDHVLWAVDVALPEADPPPVAWRNLHTLAGRAVALARGYTTANAGPVHLNFPFRKPLEPTPVPTDTPPPTTIRPLQIPPSRRLPRNRDLDYLATLIDQHEQGLIICGHRSPLGDFPTAVSDLARRTSYPILADPLSGLRFGPHIHSTPIIASYETILTPPHHCPPPSLVIRFGDLPTSKWLNQYLAQNPPEHLFHLSADGTWADDTHLVTDFWHVNPTFTCQRLLPRLTSRHQSTWRQQLILQENSFWHALATAPPTSLFDAQLIPAIFEAVPPHTQLFIGNSLPIRHVDQFAPPNDKPLTVYANRGASGIDGLVSTALGIGAAHQHTQPNPAPLVLLIGDISFYHDLNGLLALKQHHLNITIVLIHNDGGGIFNRLPIAQHDPPFTELFLTPHGLDFAPIATMYGLDYTVTTDLQNFNDSFAQALTNPQPNLIVIPTNSQTDHHQRLELIKYLKQTIHPAK